MAISDAYTAVKLPEEYTNPRINPLNTSNLVGSAGALGSAAGSGSSGISQAEKDIQSARDVLPSYKERFIENDPYAQAYERMRTGVLSSMGRQAELSRTQLQAGLERTGTGANAIRRVMARTQLDTELASRYVDAEKGLAEAGMMAADKARGAIDTYMDAYLKLASAQTSTYAAYWQSRSSGGRISMGGQTKRDEGARPRKKADLPGKLSTATIDRV